MSAPAVSIAMATFNGGAFLGEQLESIANQSVTPFELVICDDGSTDQTQKIAEAFAKHSEFPVRVHVNESRLGYVRNFRKAASLCSGELIAFCDQDDWWLPDRLEACLARFEDPELQLLYHNAWLVDERRNRFGLLYDAEREQAALDLKPLGPWNHSCGLVQILRSGLRRFDALWDESLNHIHDPMDIMSHDHWYFFLASALGRVEFLDRPLLEYRQHGSNTVGAVWARPVVENRLLKRLAHYGSQDLRLSKAAEARGSILRQMAAQLPEKALRLTCIADHYAILAERSYRRFRTYSAPGLGMRLSALISSWRKGDYSEWPWGFNRWSVLRDLWTGVALANAEPDSSVMP